MQIYALMPNLSSPCWARLVSMGKSVCRPRHRCGKLHCPCTAQPSAFESSSLCSAPKPAVAGTVLHTGMACSGGVQESQAHAACRDGRNTPARSLRPAPRQAGCHGSPSPLAGSTPACLREPFPPYAAGGAGWELDCSWIATVCAVRLVTAPPDRSLPRAQGQVGHTASSTA